MVVSVGLLSGCTDNSSEKNKFVGTWIYLVPAGTGSNYSFTYYFFSNGNFSFSKPRSITNGTFDISADGKLALINIVNGYSNYDFYSYVFSENNTKLTINGITYTKQ